MTRDVDLQMCDVKYGKTGLFRSAPRIPARRICACCSWHALQVSMPVLWIDLLCEVWLLLFCAGLAAATEQ